MQKTNEKHNDLLKLFWVFALLLFIAFGLASHAATNKSEAILLSAPNLYGKNFFSILINSPDPKEAPQNFQKFENQNVSASGVLSKGQIDFLLGAATDKKVEIIDTSSHAHGFVNNMQMVWLDQNVQFGTDDHPFVDPEKGLLEGLKKEKKVNPYTLPDSVKDFTLDVAGVEKGGGKRIQVQVEAVETEKQYLKSKKISYFRIPMPNEDIAKLENKRIDQFAEALKHLKKDEWLHVHNEQGGKSLNLALLLADVLKSAPSESLEDILKRENQPTNERIEKIYAYAKAQAPDFKKSFSSWSK